MNPQPWILSAEEVLALPIDDLAMRVLLDAHDTREWNWHNWLIKAKNHAYPSRPDVLTVLSEAWAWLINRGLVVWDPRQSAEAAIVVSRQGAEAMTRGLHWLRAVQRLDVELVPVLETKARPQFLRGDFEAAAFMAMKEVEVRVRTMANLPNDMIGTRLMQTAFNPPAKPKQGDKPDQRPRARSGRRAPRAAKLSPWQSCSRGPSACSRTRPATAESTSPTRPKPQRWSCWPTS